MNSFGIEIDYSEYASLVEHLFHARTPGMILGNPGLGKTQIPRQVAAKLGIGIQEMLGFLYEPVDFRGLLDIDQETKSTRSYSLGKWPLARFVKEGRLPERGIYLLDDALNAETSVLDAYAEPFCEHTVNGEPLAPGWVLIGTGNHIGTGTSAKAMPSHLANRMVIATLTPDWEQWAGWAAGVVRPELIGYFELSKGQELFEFKQPEPNRPYLTPRSLVNLSKSLDVWEGNNGGKRAPQWLYSTAVGLAGSKLYATVDHIHELCAFDSITKDPKKAKMPKSGEGVYSQMSILVGGMKSFGEELGSENRPKVEKVMHYTERFTSEIQTALVNRYCKAVPWFAKTPEFTAWVGKNLNKI